MKPRKFLDLVDELLGIDGHLVTQEGGASSWERPDDEIEILNFETTHSEKTGCDRYYLSVSIRRGEQK